MPNDNYEKVLALVKNKGPGVPVQVVKEIGGNTFFAGALLSQLVDEKKIFLSFVKIGSSPVYYASGQAEKLQDYYKYLHEKEQKSFDLLKKEGVLRDDILEPITRVTLRNIKDFAVPLEVTVNEEIYLFWKWYLLSDDETNKIINQILETTLKEETMPKEIIEHKTETIMPEHHEVQAQIEIEQVQEPIKDIPKEIVAEIKKEKEIVFVSDKDEFMKKIHDYFEENKIKILNCSIIKKNSEIDFIIEVPSAVGFLEYFCKSRNKKRCNEGDLSMAYLQGQLKKLPVLMITPGDITKRAAEMLAKDFKNMVVKSLK